MDFQHDRESFLGSRQPRSSQLRSQWEAPSTWEALSFDEDDRRSRWVGRERRKRRALLAAARTARVAPVAAA